VRGDDGGKKISGRKRHLVFDSRGLLRAVVVTAASADDGAMAPQGRGQLERSRSPQREGVSGDGTSHHRQWDDWLKPAKAPVRVEVVERPAGAKGLVRLPKRWVAERSFAWRGRDRRHSQDDAWFPESSKAWITISASGGMVRRLAPDETRRSVPFRYRKQKAALLSGSPLSLTLYVLDSRS
jgi:putative transposase